MTAPPPAVPVLVVGAGAMGSGIAHVAARAGHRVFLFDQAAGAAARGKAVIEQDLRFLAGKGRLSQAECAATLARVEPVAALADARAAGLAIEAIVERMEAKQSLFKELETLLADTAILATNTSSLSVTAMAAALARPERLVGMHFFNPAPRMALVEIVSGLASDPALAARLFDTARAWGKIPVHAKSTPGFIVNRVARPYYGEALRTLAENAAAPATIDAILREGCGFPMGPFELMDLIGHDVNFAVSRSVFDASFGDKRFTPSLLQQELVYAGRLGRKSGRGFYDYRAGAARPLPATEPALPGVDRVIAHGDLGAANSLPDRLAAAGVSMTRAAAPGAGWLEIGPARLMAGDGRTATRRAAETDFRNLVLFDLARDYAATPRLALAKADQCGEDAFAAVVGTLQRAGIAISRIDDIAGMVALRTVCMLANEAADAVLQGVASAADIDAAMRHGTNYPEGPLAWAGRLGFARVAASLARLGEHYGEERYRISPWLQRRALSCPG